LFIGNNSGVSFFFLFFQPVRFAGQTPPNKKETINHQQDTVNELYQDAVNKLQEELDELTRSKQWKHRLPSLKNCKIKSVIYSAKFTRLWWKPETSGRFISLVKCQNAEKSI
jgi:phosphoribosyl-AMP cyclohydrolase